MDIAKIKAEVPKIESAVAQLNASWALIKTELEGVIEPMPDNPPVDPAEPGANLPTNLAYVLSPAGDLAKYNPLGFRGQAEEGSYMILPRRLDGAIARVEVVSGMGVEIASTTLRGQRDEGRPMYRASKMLGGIPGPIFFRVELRGGPFVYYRIESPGREAKNHNQGSAQTLWVSE